MSAAVIDLSLDSESEPVAKRRKVVAGAPGDSDRASKATAERPRLLAGFGYLKTKNTSDEANRGVMGISLSDLIDQGAKWVLVSNYMIDMVWLLSAVPALLSAEQLVFVHGQATTERSKSCWQAITHTQKSSPDDMLQHPSIRAMHLHLIEKRVRSWVLHAPPLSEPYGTHHTKAFLIHCAAGVRVIVHTANLIYSDCNNKTQGIWWQDFPPKDASSPRSSDFEIELASYLTELKLDRATSQHALGLLQGHDFSSARAALVASTPGRHKGSKINKVGHMRVRTLLQQRTFPDALQGAPLVAQFSSIGSLTRPWLSELGSSFSAGRSQSGGTLGLAHAAGSVPRGLPHLVWPTVAEVRDSLEGWAAGSSIPGSHTNVTRDFLQPLFHRFGGQPVDRDRAMPHIKSYARYTEDGELAWAMLASHNMSKAAWGQLQIGNSQLHIRSFEVAVLFVTDLEISYRQHRHFGYCCSTGCRPNFSSGAGSSLAPPPSSESLSFRTGTAESVQQAPEASDTAQIVLPCQLPPVAYVLPEDAPWIFDVKHPDLDSHGCEITAERPSMYGHEQD